MEINVTKEVKQSIDYNYAFSKEYPTKNIMVHFNGQSCTQMKKLIGQEETSGKGDVAATM